MRVTSSSFPNTLITQLGSLATRQAQLQSQVATGQRVQRPEDDPGAMRRVLDLQTESKTVGQYQRNIVRQQELATDTFSAVKALKRISDRAGEIATLADGLRSPEELAIFAREIDGLIKNGVQVANTKNRGDHLFAGTRTDQPPFVLSTDAAGLVTGVTYAGNTSLAESEIAEGLTMSTQALGANSTGSGPRGLIADTGAGSDLFNHLVALRDNLLAGNTAAIAGTDRAALARDEDNLIYHIGANGAMQARLEASAAIAVDRGMSLEQRVSGEVDADLAQTLVRLNQTQNAYQAALQSGGKIINLSLLDYIR